MISSTVMSRVRVYLASTVRGDRGGVAAGRVIANGCKRTAMRSLTNHLAENVEVAEAQLTEARIFQRDLAWLTTCDVLVAASRS